MYLKLMVRGLQRHRAAGKRLFVLLAACSAAVLFCLSFGDSFVSQFRRLGIDAATAHLQILPSDSPKVLDMAFADQREGLALLDYSPDLQSFLSSLPGVSHAMLALETRAAIFTIEGEQTSFAPSLVGVDPEDLPQTLPGVTVLEGSRDLAWREGMPDVPVFRPPLEFWEVIRDNDRFTRRNFRLRGSAWEAFKARVLSEMPALFPGPKSTTDEAFLAAMNRALGRADLPDLLLARTREGYDYRIDDAQAALASFEPGSDTQRAASQVRVLRKRLLQSVYPDAITPVRDTINLNVSYTMAVPSARGDDPLAKPAVIPIRITAYVQRLPMFFYNYYVDSRALKEWLGLAESEGTSIYIRLKSNEDTAAAKRQIEQWLSLRGKGLVVRDYVELGQLFLSAASGFRILTMVLIGLFMAAVAIFTVNSVLLSLIRRRREIGTAIALGLSPGGNAMVLLGETLTLVCVSWVAGSALGAGVILAFHVVGVPGIIFMPQGRLLLEFTPSHLAISLGLFVLLSAVASLIPLRRLVGASPVELLREAS
jgi:ABC-type lipoprotein release transport system permease subunit